MKSRIRQTVSLSVALLMLGPWGTGRAAAQSLRPLTPDDVVGFWSIGATTLSPDGEWLAVEVRRPPTSPSRYRGPSNRGERSDIWLVSPRTGQTRNLTNGQQDSTGAFAPAWSPDGARLAFLSTRGRDDQLHLFVWERAGDRTRSPTSQGVLDRASFTVGPRSSAGLAWIDDRPVLFVNPPSGLRPHHDGHRPGGVAEGQIGEEATVSVLESGSAAEDRARAESNSSRGPLESERPGSPKSHRRTHSNRSPSPPRPREAGR